MSFHLHMDLVRPCGGLMPSVGDGDSERFLPCVNKDGLYTDFGISDVS